MGRSRLRRVFLRLAGGLYGDDYRGDFARVYLLGRLERIDCHAWLAASICARAWLCLHRCLSEPYSCQQAGRQLDSRPRQTGVGQPSGLSAVARRDFALVVGFDSLCRLALQVGRCLARSRCVVDFGQQEIGEERSGIAKSINAMQFDCWI